MQFFSVTVRCGAQISENCTYFESSGSEIGQCGVKICKCDANICQVIFPIRVFTRNCQDIFYTMGQNLTIHKKFLCLKNVNFEEDANKTFFKMWILSKKKKMIFWKYEFCEKWEIQNVSM